MNIKQTVENINMLPDNTVVFAERIDGEFQPESSVVLINVGEDELNCFAKNIARDKSLSNEYFLEVYLIKEMLEGWRAIHGGEIPPINIALESVIFYANNDAYPEFFFG